MDSSADDFSRCVSDCPDATPVDAPVLDAEPVPIPEVTPAEARPPDDDRRGWPEGTPVPNAPQRGVTSDDIDTGDVPYPTPPASKRPLPQMTPQPPPTPAPGETPQGPLPPATPTPAPGR